MINPKKPFETFQRLCDEHPDIFNGLLVYLQHPGYGGFFMYSTDDQITHAKREMFVKDKPREA